jgi:hypothetical protein
MRRLLPLAAFSLWVWCGVAVSVIAQTGQSDSIIPRTSAQERRQIDQPRYLIDCGRLHRSDLKLAQGLAGDIEPAGQRRSGGPEQSFRYTGGLILAELGPLPR